MDKTWILISDAKRARCFVREGGDHVLVEQADFVYPYSTHSTGVAEGSGEHALTKGHGRTGHAGTQLEPHTDPHAKGRGSFARQLADYLNEGVSEHRCDSLVLIATSPMLGEIKPCLSDAADKILKRCVASDLTHYTGPELQARVDRALQMPD